MQQTYIGAPQPTVGSVFLVSHCECHLKFLAIQLLGQSENELSYFCSCLLHNSAFGLLFCYAAYSFNHFCLIYISISIYFWDTTLSGRCECAENHIHSHVLFTFSRVNHFIWNKPCLFTTWDDEEETFSIKLWLFWNKTPPQTYQTHKTKFLYI